MQTRNGEVFFRSEATDAENGRGQRVGSLVNIAPWEIMGACAVFWRSSSWHAKMNMRVEDFMKICEET